MPSKSLPFPGDKDQKIIQRIEKWYSEALQGKNSANSEYQNYLDIYLNQQMRAYGEDWTSDVRANFCFRTIQTIIAEITEGRPTVDITPTDDQGRVFFAAVNSELFRQTWKNELCQKKMQDCVEDSCLNGVGWWKVSWDPDKRNGLGAEVVTVIDPRMVLVDDKAEAIDDSEYIIHLKWMTPKEIESKYDITDDEFGGKPQENFNAIGVEWPVRPDESGRWLVAECWYDDDEEETNSKPAINQETGDIIFDDFGEQVFEEETTPKYPFGRITTITSKRILEDKPNSYELRGVKWPFVDWVTIPLARQVVGMAIVGQLKSLQETFNDLLGIQVDNAKLTAYPKLVITDNCGIEPEVITNTPGEIYPIRPGGEINWVYAPGMPQYVSGLTQLFMFLNDNISGLQEVTQGRAPSGVRAASAIRELYTQALRGLRLQARNIEGSIERFAKIMIGIYGSRYSDARIIRIVGPQAQQMKQMYEQYISQISETGGPQVRSVGEGISDGGLTNSIFFEVTGDGFGVLYDVELVPDSSLPYTRAQKHSLGLTLYQLGLLPPELTLEMVDMPEMIKRQAIDFIAQQRQLMAAQGQGARPGQGGSAPNPQSQTQGATSQLGLGG